MATQVPEKAFKWQIALQFSLIAGVALIYVCLVGMVEEFNNRDVIDQTISLGMTLLVAIALAMGYISAWRASIGSKPYGRILLTGLVTGVASSATLAGLVLLIDPINMREMFVNASPRLVTALTNPGPVEALLLAIDETSPWVVWLVESDEMLPGLLMLSGMLMGASLSGAIIYALPRWLEKMIIMGLSAVTIIGMLEELIDTVLENSEELIRTTFELPEASETFAEFLFGRNGLSVEGAGAVFGAFAVLSLLLTLQSRLVAGRVGGLPPGPRRAVNWLSILLFIGVMALLPQLAGPFITQILVLVGLYALMGLGLNIEIGLAGLLDLGFVGFFAIGAYTVAILTTTSEWGIEGTAAAEVVVANERFWIAIPIAVGISALAGVILGIPVLRMRGDYLAIVTLGLAEIIRILVLSDFLRPLLGGAQGILNIPKPNIPIIDFVINDPQHFYYLIIIGCILVAFVAIRLKNARVGRNWMAIREDEDVAEAMGINLIVNKLLAFGIGAAFAGLSGAIFAAQLGSVFPHSFALLVSINVLSLVIVGGLGSIPGVILGAFVLVGMPELLREFSEFRLLIYGALLIVMMLVRPEGLWPSETRRRELKGDDDTTRDAHIETMPTGQPAT